MAGVGAVVKTLFGRKWWWVTLVVVALMALLARLGIWQLDRLEERRAANAQLSAAIESPPIDLNDAFGTYAGLEPGEVSPDLANRDVVMTGEFDFANQRILKLQNLSGRAGVNLITPFILDGTDTAILIDRGWIPDAEYLADNAFDEQTGSQTVGGYVALTETLLRRTAESVVPVSPGIELFRVDISAVQEDMPYPLMPFYVKAAPPVNDAAELPIPVVKDVDLSEGPHFGYAMQWFIFSLGLGIAYTVYINHWLRLQERPDLQPSS